MPPLSELIDLALRHHSTGQLAQAETLCRQVLDVEPQHAAAHHLLGLLAYQGGRHQEAIALLHRAIALNPTESSFYFNLAIVFTNLGQRAEAIACYREGLRFDPQNNQALNKLGNILRDHGQLAEAAACFRQALRIDPQQQAVYNNLGVVLALQGQMAEAAKCYRQALRIEPHYADAYYNLGIVLKDVGELEEAAQCYRDAVRLNPDHVAARLNLGTILQAQGQLAEAASCYGEALKINPQCADAYNNLGVIHVEQGQHDKAVAYYRQARNLKPENAGYHSNLLYCLLYHPDYDSAAIHEEHQHWNCQHAQPLAKWIRPHKNDQAPERRLRVGYVSPDFREHCQSLFTVPLFSAHDHAHFEICCYADVREPDKTTGRLQTQADRWRNIAGFTDEQVAQIIRRDGIDILVDLTMHMSGGRLLVFARKPAPVQVCWLAYPGTTGLTTMDYRLTDPYLDPPGQDLPHYSEESIRLPHTFWCYDPHTEGPGVGPLPALAKGLLTFGCLNNFCKVNGQVLLLWARVLRAVRDSRLLLLARHGAHRPSTLSFLARQGIAPNRVEFVPLQARMRYLAMYHQVDIGLDTLPYNGHTTSLDSFWMGVPVVTLVGQTVVGRAGLSQLTNLGLAELAANTPDEFVRLAVDLAHDVPRLQSLRATLRERMRRSPLMDAVGFAQGIEQAYRDMWRLWCSQQRR